METKHKFTQKLLVFEVRAVDRIAWKETTKRVTAGLDSPSKT